MVTYYNKKDLVSFGNYLLSDVRKERYELSTQESIKQGGNPLPTEERMKLVDAADIANWIDEEIHKD